VAVVDIDMVDTMVNHRGMSSGRAIPSRSRRQRSFAPSTRCSSVVRAGSIGWHMDGDMSTVVWPGNMGDCRCSTGQSSHTNSEEGFQLHGE
jgi:hypothetical protein